MSITFQKLCEAIKNPGGDLWQKPKDQAPADNEALQMVQRGLEIRSDRTDGNTFWDDFINVIGNNPDAAAQLLDVPRERIAKWSKKIKEVLKQVRQENMSAEEKKKKKTEMLPTGA